ncbi:MAG: tRNA (guanine-N1)-methyltransferase [Cyanobacteria bacterium P01_D01_bin.105]
MADWEKDWQTEGKARFRIGNAFFRKSSRVGRDLAVLAAIAHKSEVQSLRILDAMTGCGVRPLRYALEAKADYIWANEGNPDLQPQLAENLKGLTPERYQITHRDANAVFFHCYQAQDFYDLIDVDSFGSPMPHLSSALWAIKLGGLLYLTSTDGLTTSGRVVEKSVRKYAAYARFHTAPHEQALRLLIGRVAEQAAARDLHAAPIFAYHHGAVNRVMVRISQPHAGARWHLPSYGFIAYCHHCGHFQTVMWKQLGRVMCPCGGQQAPVVSGPMWLGPLHNAAYLKKMQQVAATCPSVSSDCDQLMTIMQAEAELPPYYYPLAEIGRRGHMDIPPRDMLISRLQAAGFMATRTHLSDQAIKTTAPMATCLEIARDLSPH